MRHHSFVIEAEAEEGIEVAQAWAKGIRNDKRSNTGLGTGIRTRHFALWAFLG